MKRFPKIDMDAVLSEMHHKDGTHYSTGSSEVGKYTGDFQC
jgi:hypothetical protein